jgi:hypothetical protein
MISVLSYREHSTKTRCGLLETAFWLLWLYQALLTNGNIPPLLYIRTAEGGRAPLYTTEQIMHAFNLLYSLLVILRTSQTPVCLNRIGPAHLSICLAEDELGVELPT